MIAKPTDPDDGHDEFHLDEGEADYEFSEFDPVPMAVANEFGPSAAFDALNIVRLLEGTQPPSRLDVHSFAYLACLVSLFDGRAAIDWNYGFSAVPPTLPFSPTLDTEIDHQLAGGLLIEQAPVGPTGDSASAFDTNGVQVLTTTSLGREEIEFLVELSAINWRGRYLRAATETVRFSTPAAVVSAMTQEPQIAQAAILQSTRKLLDEVTSEPLFEQFLAMSEAIGTIHEDLVIPASVYVRFLASTLGDQPSEDLSDA